MLMIVVMAICLCIPFAVYRVMSGGIVHSGGDFLFDVAVSLLLALIVSSLFMVCIIVPAAELTMSEPQVETMYHSEDVLASCKKKSARIELGEDAISLSREALTIKTASDDPEIQSRLDNGESVLEVYVQVSDLTLFEKRTYVLYVANEASNIVLNLFNGNKTNDSED